MTEDQKIFFKELSNIQDVVVNIVSSDAEKYTNIESMLKDVTYETIYRLMELLDGYRNNSIRCEIINTISGSCINHNIELHNYCEEYLDCTDI